MSSSAVRWALNFRRWGGLVLKLRDDKIGDGARARAGVEAGAGAEAGAEER